MKKVFVLLAAILLVLSGCTKADDSTIYQEIAQMFMDSGNYDAAEQVLSKALKTIESATLDAMLNECYDNMLEQQPTEEYYEPQPDGYDLSRTSGILASLGRSEEDFRSYCMVLNTKYTENAGSTPDDLREYPSNYVGEWFTTNQTFYVHEKFTTSDGYLAYANNTHGQQIILFDYRDDPYAPTIAEKNAIWPYAIFEGVQTVNGDDYLCFKLISVDKQ